MAEVQRDDSVAFSRGPNPPLPPGQAESGFRASFHPATRGPSPTGPCRAPGRRGCPDTAPHVPVSADQVGLRFPGTTVMDGDIWGTNRMFCPPNVPIGSRIPQSVPLPSGDTELK